MKQNIPKENKFDTISRITEIKLPPFKQEFRFNMI